MAERPTGWLTATLHQGAGARYRRGVTRIMFMRIAAFAIVALVGGVGPGWADAASETVMRLQAQLALEPGKFVGCVPGGCLRSYMRPLSAGSLDSVPVLDVDIFCKGSTVCINSEQSAYDLAKGAWSLLNFNDRDICVLTAKDDSTGGTDAAFYKKLAACIDSRLETRMTIEQYTPKKFQP